MCHLLRARACACARDVTASRLTTSGSIQSAYVSESAARPEEGWGDPGLRTAFPGGHCGPTPVLLPHVRGIESIVQSRVSLNRTQLQSAYVCIGGIVNMALSPKRGVTPQSRDRRRSPPVRLYRVSDVMESIRGVLPL